jgi:lipoprotein-anchoring transpeptidase ErfK/SrfK
MGRITSVRQNLCCWAVLLASLVSSPASLIAAEEEAKPKVKKEIRVNVDEQTLAALENGESVYTFDIVSGKPDKETLVGTFKIARKHEKYVSKTYGSEMPYTMFFTDDGKAIHGTNMATLRSYLHTYLTESVGSQGCVGLTDDNAKLLFDWAPVGTPVVVVSEEP